MRLFSTLSALAVTAGVVLAQSVTPTPTSSTSVRPSATCTYTSGVSTPSSHVGIWQAENAVKTGVTVGNTVTGFTGTGYVENFDRDGDSLVFTMSASGAFENVYDLLITYNGPYGDKFTTVKINSEPGFQVALPATTGWRTINAGQIFLPTGSNTLTIENNWGWYLLDKIEIGVAGCFVEPTVTSATALPTSTGSFGVWEAENGTFDGTAIETSYAGFSGTGYVGSFDDAGDTLTIDLSSAGLAAGSYDLTITYQSPFGEKYTTMRVTGSNAQEVYLAPAEAWTTVLAGTITLTGPATTISFTTSWGWYYIDKIELWPVGGASTTPPTPTSSQPPPSGTPTPAVGIHQAEDAYLGGVTVGSTVTGYTGTGYVEGFDLGSDTLIFFVSSATQKLYDLTIRYQAPNGDKYTRLSLNGGGGGEVFFPAGTTWATAAAGQVLLNAGVNTIALQNHWGWYLIDSIELKESVPRGPHQVTTTLSDPAANAVTKRLHQYLISLYGNYILSGQQDAASYAWVETNIGKSPAMLGIDLMDYSPSRVERGTTSTQVEDGIAFDKRGGIVTVLWHWNAPTGLFDSDAQPWWRGFYVEATDFNLEATLANKAGANYTLLIRDIDAIAVQLKRLEAAGLPVIWRPLHEAEGGWFWWGRDKKPEPVKELWRIMHDRLVNYHGIHNLIWVWNSVAADWYPGDDVVDIVAYDSYPSAGDHGPVSGAYNNLVNLVKDKKLVALTEVGVIPDPDLLQVYEADWSWFMVWNGDFIQDGVWNENSFLKRIYFTDYVLTLDEIQGWKGTLPPVSSSSTRSSSSTSSTRTSSSTRPSSSSSSTRPSSSSSSTRPSSSSSSTRTSSSTRPSSSSSSTRPSSSSSSTRPSSSSSSTRVSSTSSTRTSTAPVATQTVWGQCGGNGYTGPTVCASGSTCDAVSPPWYYQCRPPF